MKKHHTFNFILLVLLSLLANTNAERSRVRNFPQITRRILHQPLFPVTPSPPSSGDESLPPEIPDEPFFPSGSNPNPTPPPPIPAQPTNESAHIPAATQPTNPTKKVAVVISVGIVTLGMLSGLAFYLYKHKAKEPAETQKLVSGDSIEESNSRVPPSSFLYIGTVEPSSNQRSVMTVREDNINTTANGSPLFHKLNSDNRLSGRYRPSPDLLPLPPLNKAPTIRKSSTQRASLSSSDEESRDTMFYTPHGSVSSNDEGFWTTSKPRSTTSRVNGRSMSNSGSKGENYGNNSFPHSKRTSPRSRLFDSSPDVVKHAIVPSIKTTPTPQTHEELELRNTRECQTHNKQEMRSSLPKRVKFAPPPPPPNLALLRTLTGSPPQQKSKPPARPTPPPPAPPPPPPPPSRPLLSTPKKVRNVGTNGPPQEPQKSPLRTHNSRDRGSPRQEAKPDEEHENGCNYYGRSNGDDMYETRPKLKPLHWDKVRATSDREMVWDQLKSSSFQLNEDMMESLFGCNSSTSAKKEATQKSAIPPAQKEISVLDPKKSQNIAILLRALNVTKDEVVDALLDGNPEGMGAELLETLVKMAPTKEEEIKLKDYNGDSTKLGSAERFLKGILDIPFAFKRVEAMLYRANFDGEVKYLRAAFETLEIASEELKNSRLFLKLLEAVLQAGNRMNVGTNRGEAKSFKLDTLLKLADIKGTDGKTTLLHFVVQEILRSESIGSDSIAQTLPNQLNSIKKEEEFRKQGLHVLSGLSKELASVRSAAGMDSDVLSNYVLKLEMGLKKVNAVLHYEKPEMQGMFFESMKVFLKEAEQEIARVKAHERKALAHVREVTQYFHGDTAKEEAHPFRVFLIVRDFLSVLDNVCKEVGGIEERTMMGTARSFRISAYASLPVLTKYIIPRDYSSGEDGMSS